MISDGSEEQQPAGDNSTDGGKTAPAVQFSTTISTPPVSKQPKRNATEEGRA